MTHCTTLPEQTVLPVSPQETQRIIDTLQSRERNVSSLRGLFHAKVAGKGVPFAQTFQGSILYRSPDRYRIKGFNRFGGLLFDFLVSSQNYALRVQDHPRPMVGRMDNLHALEELRLPVLLSLRALDVLVGNVLDHIPDGLRIQESGEGYILEMPLKAIEYGEVLSQRILLEPESWHILKVEYINADGETLMAIQASDFRQVPDRSSSDTQAISLPFTIHAEDEIQDGSLALEFLEIMVNESLNQDFFSLTAF